MWGAETGMGWWMLWGSVWFVLLWGLIIWAVLRVAGGGSERGSERQAGARPIELAQRRYASGEISREQFEQIKRDLGVA